MLTNLPPVKCEACANGTELGFPIAVAFQPIVDAARRTIYAHEALVRGAEGESAGSVLGRIGPDDIYRFDQSCRVAAIRQASALGLATRLHLNFLPNAVYNPENCIRVTLAAAEAANMAPASITFEIVEGEKITDVAHVKSIFAHYRELGFLTALDDFGEGYSGFNLLAEIQPDIVKLDLRLVHGIDGDRVRRSIVSGFATIAAELGILVIAEGVETEAESALLLDRGITLQQGYLFARPAFRGLAVPVFPDVVTGGRSRLIAEGPTG
jgi:EAL domain-containing protein (putative c-di-GMP-specific phosphodiesterase class I)